MGQVQHQLALGADQSADAAGHLVEVRCERAELVGAPPQCGAHPRIEIAGGQLTRGATQIVDRDDQIARRHCAEKAGENHRKQQRGEHCSDDQIDGGQREFDGTPEHAVFPTVGRTHPLAEA